MKASLVKDMSAAQLIAYLTQNKVDPNSLAFRIIKEHSGRLTADAYRLQRLIIGLENAS